MASATLTAPAHSRRMGRSTAAVAAGFLSVAVLSLVIDQILHVLQVYPPWGEPMYEPALNVLALSYRMALSVMGGYVTARLAPHAPMRHVWVLAIIGLIAASVGAAVAIEVADLGPIWYPVALAVSAVPTTWFGGVLYCRRHV